MIKKWYEQAKKWAKGFFELEDVREEMEEVREVGRVVPFRPRVVAPAPAPRRVEEIEKQIREQRETLRRLEEKRMKELKREFSAWKDNIRQYDNVMSKIRQA